MAEARQRDNWNHTAAILAKLHNTSGFAEEAHSPEHYHPFPIERDPEPEPTAEELQANWAAVKQMVESGGFR